jgi:hypothetical protein
VVGSELSSWRGWWLAIRGGSVLRIVLYGYFVGLFSAIWSVVVGLSMHRPHWFVVAGLCFALTVAMAVAERPPAALRVTIRNQPDLYELVHSVARRLGTPMPRRVWLTHRADVSAGMGRRLDLLIGLPLVDCMSASQLSALIGHELTLLAQPRSWMTRQVHRVWSDRSSMYEKSAKDAALLAKTGGFASTVDASADQAAAVAAGSFAVAAEAFGLAAIASDEHFWFERRVNELSTQGKTLIRIRDVEDGWRHLLGTGRGFFPPGFWDPEHVGLGHPGLAYALSEAPSPRLGQPLDRVPVAALSPADQRRIVGKRREAVYRREPWLTFADISPQRVNDVASQGFERARGEVAKLLGRPVPDEAEVVAVLAHRGDELAAQALGPIAEDDDEEDDEEGSSWILIDAAEFLLLGEGWRTEHPAVQGVLISPDGRRVDLRPLRPVQIEELLTSEHALA